MPFWVSLDRVLHLLGLLLWETVTTAGVTTKPGSPVDEYVQNERLKWKRRGGGQRRRIDILWLGPQMQWPSPAAFRAKYVTKTCLFLKSTVQKAEIWIMLPKWESSTLRCLCVAVLRHFCSITTLEATTVGRILDAAGPDVSVVFWHGVPHVLE